MPVASAATPAPPQRTWIAPAAPAPNPMSAAGGGAGHGTGPLPAFAGIAVPNHRYPPVGAPHAAGGVVPLLFIAGHPVFIPSQHLSVPTTAVASASSSSSAAVSSSEGGTSIQAMLGASMRSSGFDPRLSGPGGYRAASALLSGSRGASGGTALTRRASLPGMVPARRIHTSRDTVNEDLFAALIRKARTLPETARLGPAPEASTAENPTWLFHLRQATHYALTLLQGLDSYSRQAWGDGPLATLIAHSIRDQGVALADMLPPGIPVAHVSVQELLRLFAAEVNSPTPDVDRLLIWANTACFEARRIAGDAPLFAVDEGGVGEFRLILRMLDEARKSPLSSIKKNYFRELGARVLPRCETDISYLQAVSMLAGYVHIDFECVLPFTPRTSLLLSVEHQARVRKTRSLRLARTLLQTGGRHAGFRQYFWEGIDSKGEPTGLMVINSMGTNSDGANRDVVLKAKQVATGALANIDQQGIGYTASQAAAPRLREIFADIPKDTVFVCIGHSLGASIAAETFALLHMLEFENTYLATFNGGAINHDVPERVLGAARTQAMLVQNQGDPVPYGGKHILPGMEKIHTAQHVGTIARGEPHWLFPNWPDVINHGIPNEVAQFMYGSPGTASTQLHQQLASGYRRQLFMALRTYLPWLPNKALTTVLKPDPIEAGKTEDSFLEFVPDGDKDDDAPAKH
ncbi:hypothetical protein JYJ95_20425 [Corallococcus exiguus]|uniref:hypothetical protein n=1 Tax=Corallococcus exiguus TaxID=83462 RepID=UPI001A8F0E75|nr:hypothetical protein [Corallococcus exiguus]MBN8468873.1 hypothetical protein [Corallococcus exiguus]